MAGRTGQGDNDRLLHARLGWKRGGFTLLVQPQSNTITELGSDDKPRWTLTGLQGLTDAQVLPNQHVLIAEQGRVTERDLSGKVLWKPEAIQPLAVQRLPMVTPSSPATVCLSKWTARARTFCGCREQYRRGPQTA